MIKIDLLKLLYNNEISEEEAISIFEYKVDEFHEKGGLTANELTLLDNYEFSAMLHVPLKIVAMWRYEGWPKVCLFCDEKIDYKNWNWVSKKINNQYGIIHINPCLNEHVNIIYKERYYKFIHGKIKSIKLLNIHKKSAQNS